MDSNNRGTVIESFVSGCYEVMFDQHIEVRHHPVTSWAQATVSREQHNFGVTKERLIETANGLAHALREKKEDGHTEKLSELIAQFEAAQSPLEAGDIILAASPWLDDVLPVVDVDSFFPKT